MSVIFITGIDTSSGKTIATGLIAKYLMNNNKSVITQKMVQTGCTSISEDIITHRKIMGIDLTEDDKSGITCPYVFEYPGSPHLSAKLQQKIIDPEVIDKATAELEKKYDYVLLEGVGGISVPLTSDLSILDFLQNRNYPIVLVTSPKLGSINHTLLTLEVMRNRNLNLLMLVYNLFPETDSEITIDTKDVFKNYISQVWFNSLIIDIPVCNKDSMPNIDFRFLM